MPVPTFDDIFTPTKAPAPTATPAAGAPSVTAPVKSSVNFDDIFGKPTVSKEQVNAEKEAPLRAKADAAKKVSDEQNSFGGTVLGTLAGLPAAAGKVFTSIYDEDHTLSKSALEYVKGAEQNPGSAALGAFDEAIVKPSINIKKLIGAVVPGTSGAMNEAISQEQTQEQNVAAQNKTDAQKKAAVVGNVLGFIGPMVATEGIFDALPIVSDAKSVEETAATLTKTLGMAVKAPTLARFITSASDVASFVTADQLTYDPKTDGSRKDKALIDLATWGVFKGLGIAVSGLKASKFGAAADDVLARMKAGEKVPLAEAEQAVQTASQTIENKTGSTIQELVKKEVPPEELQKLSGADLSTMKPPAEAPEPKSSSVTLNSQIVPGAPEFIQQDVIPAAKQVAEGAKEVKNAVNPASASESAQATADIVREAKAKVQNVSDMEYFKNRPIEKAFKGMSDEENIANISEYERTGKFANAPAGYSEAFQKSMDTARSTLQAVYGDDRVGYVENYVRRQFVFGTTADEAKATGVLSNYMQSLSASKNPLKARALDVPLDEALQYMREAGLDVKPATTNPETLRQWSVANARQAATYADAWTKLKDQSLITFAKSGDKIPEGMVKLDDKVATVMYPSEKGLVLSGQYYADSNVARILNNTISTGLGSSAVVKGLRTVENTLNQFQLGFSAFHFTTSSFNAGITDIALGLRKVLNGDITGAAKDISLGATGIGSFAKDVWNGKKLIDDLAQGSPEAKAFVEDVLSPAGGRLQLDQRYRTDAVKSMTDAWNSGNIPGAVIRMPAAITETLSKPLMQYSVPRLKLGAFMDLSSEILKNLPEGATPEMRQRALANAWDSIDNRFGQLTYDNLFWNKTGKDMAMLATRSVGWNLGTVRELGGGIKDIATETLRGKGVTDRTLYTAVLPVYTAMIGAIYMYLHTGKAPQTMEDYFVPQNGGTTANGDPDRSNIPGYMKDVYSYGTNPVQTALNKSSPLLSMATGLLQNKDYYGDMVRNPDDPIGTQLQQTGAYLLKQVVPFSLQSLTKSQQTGESTERQAESFMGFSEAPNALTQSDKTAAVEKAFRQQAGSQGSRTPEQVDIASLKSKARTELKKGDRTSLNQLIKLGAVKPGLSERDFIKAAMLTPSGRLMKNLKKTTKAQINKQFPNK